MTRVSRKEINRLAVPAIFSGIAEPLISLVDTAFIGHLGAEQLAGAGIAASFFTLIIWVLSQTKSAVSAIVSRYYGKGQLDRLKSLISQAFLLNALLGLAFLLITSYFSTEIFQLYKASGQILLLADDYFSIRSLGFPIALCTMSLFGTFRGLQNTLWAMKISLIGGLINLALDYVFIFGVPAIIPAMGLKGAALASLVAQFVMLSMAIRTLLVKTTFNLKLSRQLNAEVFNLLALSGNLFVRTMALNFAFFMANRTATGLGAQYIAAHTIALNIWLFSAFFIDGYASAGNAIAGKLLGEQNFRRLYRFGIDLSKISLLIGFLLAVIYTLIYPIVGDFFTKEAEVKQLLRGVFWLVIITQPINAVAFALDGIFKGLGEARHLRNVLLVSTFFVFLPTLLLAEYLDLMLMSIWVAFFCWMIGRALLLVIPFYRKYHSAQ